ncbi:MAG: hypothetical protein WBD27_18645 [Pyrinomonadaceae bacterium]
MESFRITYDELFPYIIAANITLGFLFGSFPLIAGLILKNRKYGVFGFVGSIIGGAVLGVFLSFPFAVVFLWLILRQIPKPSFVETGPSPSDTSHDIGNDSSSS